LFKRLAPPGVAFAAGLVLPAPLSAHLVTTGLGPFYDGIFHLLLSPEDLVPVLAVALLAGVSGPAVGRRMLFALSAAWLGGGLLGLQFGGPLIPAGALSLSFLLLGALIAGGRNLSRTAATPVAVAVGLLHGWLNGVGIAESRREWPSLVGMVSTEFVVAAILAAIALAFTSGWMRIAVRVAGSWIAATGVLMLGWSLRAAG
jgi:hydrogenase/urease accessory protein HupE